MAEYQRVEDLQVYQKLCELHLEVCATVRRWPREDRFELTSQILRSSNSSPANLAEKHADRHVRNKIEGINRARGEAGETVHHLYVARLKGYVTAERFEAIRERYNECFRMLNGLERFFERELPSNQQLWPTKPDPSASDPDH